MLKEVHHRVKNNLQIVISLIKLQSNNSLNHLDAHTALNEISGRIRSIASVHEQLYSSNDFSQIRLDNYLVSLIDNIFLVRGGSQLEATPKYKLQKINIDLDRSVSLGLIVNEIVTNALKYGVKENKLNLDISIKEEQESIVLSISDKGAGFDYQEEVKAEKGIGLFLIQELSEQIGAELICDSNANGTSFELKIQKAAL